MSMNVNHESNIYEIYSDDDFNLSSFEPQDELNSKIWIDENTIDPKVRRSLLSIAKDFITDLDFKIDVLDVVITGSLANYNWSPEYSDIDLHIIADLRSVDKNYNIISDYFKFKKRLWSQEHDGISIMGYPVEIYVQDKNEPHNSSGIFSLLYNEWIEKPSKFDDDIDGDSIKDSATTYMTDIDELEDELIYAKSDKDFQNIYDKAVKLFDNIKKERTDSMKEPSVELSTGNLVFKTLRRNGYIDKLIDIRSESYDKAHSL